MTENVFHERLSKYLWNNLKILKEQYGPDSSNYLGLARQYLKDPREENDSSECNIKHYEAEVAANHTNQKHSGIERLYRRQIVIEPTMVCSSHCRYCLRSNYPRYTLTEKQLNEIARYCGNEENRNNLREVLITGGDPLIIPNRVNVLLEALIEYAPNIRTARIATRLLTQDPIRIDEDVLRIFKNKPSLRFELATQINHPVELSFKETIDAIDRIHHLGVKIYSQNVLLKGINDNLSTLINLYDGMRENNIEAHYLFHAIPIKGTHHLRTSVNTGIQLARDLTNSGFISGRVKPMFAAMTDIGKITFYEGTILERKGSHLLLKSGYKITDRLLWNPTFHMPPNSTTDKDGNLNVWYLDGED
jgi:lysine 2,3-aminomutase